MAIIVLVAALGIIFWGVKLYRHEKRQNADIAQIHQLKKAVERLQSDNEILKERLDQEIEYYNYETHYRDDGYNYFAIGNSLTLIKDWGRGICATKPDNDYFGLVKAGVSARSGRPVVAYRYNFAAWERSYDRKACLRLLNPCLDASLDLVTIQLGENARDLSTFENDLVSLIQYVREKAPKARIIVVGDFWDKRRNDLRRNAAARTGCDFANLAPIIGDTSYQSKAGTEAEAKDGSTRQVTPIEETHPGDAGMKYISDRILEKVN